VRGDLAANYGAVMQVMGALSGAGFAKIGLITEQARQDQ
jgi:biopolymer transport protein TolR